MKCDGDWGEKGGLGEPSNRMAALLRRSTEAVLFRFMKKLGCWLVVGLGWPGFFMKCDGDWGEKGAGGKTAAGAGQLGEPGDLGSRAA